VTIVRGGNKAALAHAARDISARINASIETRSLTPRNAELLRKIPMKISSKHKRLDLDMQQLARRNQGALHPALNVLLDPLSRPPSPALGASNCSLHAFRCYIRVVLSHNTCMDWGVRGVRAPGRAQSRHNYRRIKLPAPSGHHSSPAW